MTSTTPRIITVALLVLAVAAPMASARPLRDDEGVQRRRASPARRRPPARTCAAPTPGPRPSRRSRARTCGTPTTWHRASWRRCFAGRTATPARPVSTPAVATDDDPSPFVYIIPAIALIALGATGFAFARTRRSTRRTPA